MRGVGEYPENWDEISLRVKDEAGWRCVRCRHPDFAPGERGPGRRCGWRECDPECCHPREKKWKQRVLTVHHLDGDKENQEWWNLMAACQVCHLQVQGKVNMGQGYFLEISEWMKPYVGGMVAHYVLEEDLTREEVMGRLEELIGLWEPEVIGGR